MGRGGRNWCLAAAGGFAAMAAGAGLVQLGWQMAGQIVAALGLAAFLIAGMGFMWWMERHPARHCPSCGKGLPPRGLRTPEGGLPKNNGDPVCCPHCGAMFYVWDSLRHKD